MQIAPSYGAIKTRALALLNAAAGFNGFPATEVWSDEVTVRINVGLALINASDEIDPETPFGRNCFNKGNFDKALAEITREWKRGVHWA